MSQLFKDQRQKNILNVFLELSNDLLWGPFQICKSSKEDSYLWMVGWVLWRINLCRLFNAKSIFIQIVSSISNNSV